MTWFSNIYLLLKKSIVPKSCKYYNSEGFSSLEIGDFSGLLAILFIEIGDFSGLLAILFLEIGDFSGLLAILFLEIGDFSGLLAILFLEIGDFSGLLAILFRSFRLLAPKDILIFDFPTF